MRGYTLQFLIAALFVTLFVPSLVIERVVADDESVILDTDLKAEKVPLKTSDNTVELEAEAISNDGFSIADRALLKEESHSFKAEINQLMSIIINSLYSNRDIFVRELISNAADAITKIRFMSLSDPSILGENQQFEIRIKFDKDEKLLHFRDTGIGMTKNELIKNLGSIAKSGTKEFLEKVSGQDGNPTVDTIGQFGVGFYSSFLVADKVTVTSKHNDDEQHVWEASSDDPTAYAVAKDPRGNTLGRGTLITLTLKDDAVEYLDQQKLKDLIMKYNQFISYPIFLWSSKTETREIEVEKEEIEDEELTVEEEEEEATPKTETVTVWGWERINQNQPLWTKNKADITEEEYLSFYKDVLASHDEPLERIHFKAEGDAEFSALLYIPSSLPYGFWEPGWKSQLKLYVKRVFITDNFAEMIPHYLAFVKGILDSDDLDLNVSREMLQENKHLTSIKKKLIRKILSTIQDLADDKDKEDAWNTFYDNFATNLKMGTLNDPYNRVRISKLLRFYSAKSTDKRIGFEEYIQNMKKSQTDIYYLGGETIESIRASPIVENLKKRGYDVLFLPDPIDEYCITTIAKYDGKFTLVDVSKEGLKLTDAEEEKQKELDEKFAPLSEYLKGLLEDKVSRVSVSTTISKAPAVLVSQSWSSSANMERIMKAQALKDQHHSTPISGKRILEINPRHPITKKLLQIIQDNAQDDSTVDIVHILYDTAVLNSGYAVSDSKEVTTRINKLISSSLNIDSLQVEEEVIEELEQNDNSDLKEKNEEEIEQAVEAELEKDVDLDDLFDQADLQ